MHAILKRSKLDDKVKAVETMNNNLLLDNISYEVEFDDGTTEFLTANIISENLLAQVDEEGNSQMRLDEIIDHIGDVNTIGKENAFMETTNGMKRIKMTTTGWQLCIQLKYGSTDLVALKEIKQSYPVELEDYTKRMKIDGDPTFSWLVPYVQKKRVIILSKVRSKYWQQTKQVWNTVTKFNKGSLCIGLGK